MRIVIAGGHGKISLRLAKVLATRGVDVLGLIRNPDHTLDVEAAAARPVLIDLEKAATGDVARALAGADAAVFAAGAGPGSGVARKYTVDKGGSVLLADAAENAGVRRFLQISSMGAGQPPAADADEVWEAYIDAKTQAEDDLRARDLDWTIVRPGRLLDVPGTGRVTLTAGPAAPGAVPREDVAAVLAELLLTGRGTRTTLELTEGDTPVGDAVAQQEH
ncbi:NAD(P)H-binding protein [Streptomyces tendae]|uniref:NAD(P)H-binding protein n=1 Tax=Streptomyces tendae TaxID=1932 RepID=UPI0036673374